MVIRDLRKYVREMCVFSPVISISGGTESPNLHSSEHLSTQIILPEADFFLSEIKSLQTFKGKNEIVPRTFEYRAINPYTLTAKLMPLREPPIAGASLFRIMFINDFIQF